MPYINIMGKNIYYKEYGSGEPIVFLNGVMMSTNSWSPFIKPLSSKYKMITVDLLDQGKSDSSESQYTIDIQAEILENFLNRLGLNKIHLVGMSYGGKIAQTFTIKYQDKVESLVLSNTDSYTTNIMKEIGKGWSFAASTLDGAIISSIIFPYMYSPSYYEKNYSSMQKKEKAISKEIDEKWFNRFERILNSAVNYNVYNQIKNIKVPTLIISSELDIITPIKYQKIIHQQIEGSRWIIIKDTGHAAMYEKSEEYISIIMDFLYKR